jgi:hypothetical protein
MKRIDHILFQANPDFIAYLDSQPLPGGDLGLEPCDCFGHFIASQARAKKDVSQSMHAIESVLREGGFNAEQLRQCFFPALNVALNEEEARSTVVTTFGPLSVDAWRRLQVKVQPPVI